MTHLQQLIDAGRIELTADGRPKLTRQAWQDATRGGRYEERGMFHFVGFKDDRYHAAVRVWGKPDFIHRFWDRRAVDEVMPEDVVIFATGDEHQVVTRFAFDDSANF